ncbi:MAG TPA: hypothetical protein VGK30_00855 [Candidatus Binatia bacterium]|jgi:hypothetical protein
MARLITVLLTALHECDAPGYCPNGEACCEDPDGTFRNCCAEAVKKTP